MTNKLSPEEFRSQWSRIAAMAREEGRDPAALGSALYHNININEDRQAALEESKAFLDTYYTANFSAKFVEGWTAAGSPAAVRGAAAGLPRRRALAHRPAADLVGSARSAQALPRRGGPGLRVTSPAAARRRLDRFPRPRASLRHLSSRFTGSAEWRLNDETSPIPGSERLATCWPSP